MSSNRPSARLVLHIRCPMFNEVSVDLFFLFESILSKTPSYSRALTFSSRTKVIVGGLFLEASASVGTSVVVFFKNSLRMLRTPYHPYHPVTLARRPPDVSFETRGGASFTTTKPPIVFQEKMLSMPSQVCSMVAVTFFSEYWMQNARQRCWR